MLSGMVTLVSWLSLNALFTISVTLSGMVTLVSRLFSNILLPIVVTDCPCICEGITTAVSVPLYAVIVPFAKVKGEAACAVSVCGAACAYGAVAGAVLRVQAVAPKARAKMSPMIRVAGFLVIVNSSFVTNINISQRE